MWESTSHQRCTAHTHFNYTWMSTLTRTVTFPRKDFWTFSTFFQLQFQKYWPAVHVNHYWRYFQLYPNTRDQATQLSCTQDQLELQLGWTEGRLHLPSHCTASLSLANMNIFTFISLMSLLYRYPMHLERIQFRMLIGLSAVQFWAPQQNRAAQPAQTRMQLEMMQ